MQADTDAVHRLGSFIDMQLEWHLHREPGCRRAHRSQERLHAAAACSGDRLRRRRGGPAGEHTRRRRAFFSLRAFAKSSAFWTSTVSSSRVWKMNVGGVLACTGWEGTWRSAGLSALASAAHVVNCAGPQSCVRSALTRAP